MKTRILKQTAISAVLTLSANAASAQSITFNFDYIAQAQTNSALTTGASLASLSSAAQSVGSITFTDLADLNLGDGKTGVRISTTLNNLNQFSSGTGTISSNTIEFSFPGTGGALNPATGKWETTGGLDWLSTPNTLRNTSGAQWKGGVDGGIEWDEHGSVGNGTVNTPTSSKWAFFQQQNNILAGTWTEGQTTVFDYLNGDTLTGGSNVGQAFDGFSVANLVSVANQNTAKGLPNAWAWLRVVSTDNGIQKTDQWFDPFLNNAANGTQTLNFLAVQAVPEPETYAMLLAGLGLIGFMARRRSI